MNSPKTTTTDEEPGKEVPLNQNASPILNPHLLQVMIALMGKEVLVETKDGKQFRGVFATYSPDITDFGVFDAYEVTAQNQGNLLAKKDELIEKLQFHFDDVACVSVRYTEATESKGFATDAFYHDRNGVRDGELQEWEADDGSDAEVENERDGLAPGHWSIDDMYAANDKLGVQSTYEESLSLYTNAEVVDDPSRRAEIERIACSIEKNKDSKRFARLENDDEERDINQMTHDEDFEPQKRRTVLRGRGNAFTINRRSEALRGQSGRGMQSSGNSRFGNQNSSSRPEWKDSSSRGLANNREREGFSNNKKLPDKQPTRSSDVRVNQARHEEMHRWSQEFKLGTTPAKDEAVTSSTIEVSTTGNSVVNSSPRGSANAWNNGPPQSLVSTHNGVSLSTTSPTTTMNEPQTSAQNEESPEPGKTDEDYKKEEDSNVGGEESSPSDEPKKTQDTAASVKHFQFNLNAPAFVPGQKSSNQNEVPITMPPPMVPNQMPSISSGMSANAIVPPPPVMIQQSPMVLQYAPTPQMYQPMAQTYAQYGAAQAGNPQRGPPIIPNLVAQNRRQLQQQPPPQPQQAMVFGASHYPSQVYQPPQPLNMQTAQYFPSTYPTTSVPPPQQAYVQQMTMASPQPVVSMSYMPQQLQQYQVPPMYAMQQGGAIAAVQRYQAPQQSRAGNSNVDVNFIATTQMAAQTQRPNSQPPTPGPHGANIGLLPVQSGNVASQQHPVANTAPPFVIASAQAPLFYGNQQMYYQGQIPMQQAPMGMQQLSHDSQHEQLESTPMQQFDHYGTQYVAMQQGQPPQAYYPPNATQMASVQRMGGQHQYAVSHSGMTPVSSSNNVANMQSTSGTGSHNSAQSQSPAASMNTAQPTAPANTTAATTSAQNIAPSQPNANANPVSNGPAAT